jgi:NAD(P)-dependent dehydrogenase (short-subunit alcohol dehydrogenase family)
MKSFQDKVAVITGGGSGIGRALGDRCVREEMKVVLADIEEKALIQAETEMRTAGASVIGVVTDVSKAESVENLFRKTIDAFGAVHLLCNNAGIGARIPSIWESTVADWEWSLGVNLWSVIHGLRTFVPRMLEQDSEAHIVNTASVVGLMVPPGGATYTVSKHGVVVLSEILYHELKDRNSKIGVSVLCPGFVNTRIIESERNRPDALKNPPCKAVQNDEYEARVKKSSEAVKSGMSPEQVADAVFDAIGNEKFYIMTHPEFNEKIRIRTESILAASNPVRA